MRPMNFQRKIDLIINEDKLEQIEISYSDFSELIECLAWDSEEKFELMGGLHKIIDKLFNDQT
jgi:hypothetical protein